MISGFEILKELRHAWAEQFGTRREIGARASIVQWLRDERLWDEVDIAEIEQFVVDHFGAVIPADEWSVFWGKGTKPDVWDQDVVPGITFGRLADLIQANLADVSFEPVRVAGRACGPAGAFFGMRRLAVHVSPSMPQFRPATLVKAGLTGDALPLFWSQLRILTRNAIAPLGDPLADWSTRTAGTAIGSGLVLLLLICLHIVVDLPMWVLQTGLLGFAMTTVSVLVLCLVGYAGGTRLLRLPDGILTFRDLAEQVSAARLQGSS